jgi:hypothetical protein
MPDEYGNNWSDDELGLNTDVVESLDPNLRDEIRKSRSRAREAHEWKQRAEAAERQIVVRDVGIDTGSKLGQMFMKSYEGEWTAAAIQAEAEQIPGLLTPHTPPPPDDGQRAAEEQLATQRRMAGAGTAPTAGGPDLQTQFNNDLRAAKSPEDVMALIDNADPSLGVYRKGLQ